MVDLVPGGDFEDTARPTSCFRPFSESDGTVVPNADSPLAGANSATITVRSWSRVGCIRDYPWQEGPIAKTVTAEGDLRIDTPTSGTKQLRVCAVAYFEDTSDPEKTCERYAPGGGAVHVRVIHDARDRRIARVFFQIEDTATQAWSLTLDNAHLWVEQVRGSAGPRGGSGGGGGGGGGASTGDCDVSSQEAPSGPPVTGGDCDQNARPSATSVYTPTTLALVPARPYISLNDYKQATAASAIGTLFKSYVDRNLVRENDWGYSPADAVIMYERSGGIASGDIRYLNAAISQVDATVAAAEADIVAGHAPEVAGDSYLHMGDTIEALALAYDYGIAKGLLTTDQQTRWKKFGDQAVANLWNPWLATWGDRPAGAFSWTAWSINNPGNNYFFSFLRATEMWALTTRSDPWLRFLQEQKFPLVEDYYVRITSGGSREGTGYGTAVRGLYEAVRMWHSATGEWLPNVVNHARATIDYWIHATVPAMDRYASIGDTARDQTVTMYDYQENLVREAVALNPGTDAARRGMWWIHHNSVPDTLTASFNYRSALMVPADADMAPTATTYNAAAVGQYFARSSWASDATWLNFTAGTYDETHAHHSQGSFQLYRNGWQTQTANIYSVSGLEGNGKNGDLGADALNVVRFQRGDGSVIGQDYSDNTMTVDSSGGVLRLHGDLRDAYSSGTEVSAWTRDLTFSGNTLHVHDVCSVSTGVRATFQLHSLAKPVVTGPGAVTAGRLGVTFDPTYTVQIVDMRATYTTGSGDTLRSRFVGGWRLDLSKPGTCAFDVDLVANP